MNIERRTILKMISIGALAQSQISRAFGSSNGLVSSATEELAYSKLDLSNQKHIEELYKKSIVIDGLVIPRGWNQDSFDALPKSGYTGFAASLVSYNLKLALNSIAEWHQRIEDNPDKLLFATTAADFIRAKKENKTAVLFGFQNSTMIERSIDNIDLLYEKGTRWIQLTYNQRNLLGDGSTERTNSGLSDFGVEAVERMNDLGIIVDLSHCGPKTTDDGIHFSKAPASCNHTMCEALHRNHPRAKTDKQIKALADKGGVIGIISLGYMLGPKVRKETTLETYIDHIDHAVKIGGIDHVAVASDFAVQGLEASGATKENWYTPRLTRFKPSYKVQWPAWIPELDAPERFLNVAKALDRRGYSTGDIEKILGLNWIRYYDEVLK
ncbi:dipeptidase [Paraglaciecola sp. 2405UD69-4]|uniref:dipeptidase n=1 Tax=Paraglaciecola sp. 2405UD69-4 TaxID=3391836 RepID=UPI0039C9A104